MGLPARGKELIGGPTIKATFATLWENVQRSQIKRCVAQLFGNVSEPNPPSRFRRNYLSTLRFFLDTTKETDRQPPSGQVACDTIVELTKPNNRPEWLRLFGSRNQWCFSPLGHSDARFMGFQRLSFASTGPRLVFLPRITAWPLYDRPLPS